jgi:hypothetical protein
MFIKLVSNVLPKEDSQHDSTTNNIKVISDDLYLYSSSMNDWWIFIGYCFLGLAIISCIYLYYVHMSEAELTCIVSSVDGEKYCVRRREKLKEAANILATTVQQLQRFISHLHEKYPDRADMTRLFHNFNPRKIEETLPTSKYTAFTENKSRMSFCLNVSNDDNEEIIDENTLMFVALHEISHMANATKGHDHHFWSLFKFILEEAKQYHIYTPVDYSKQPQEYCSLPITSNPMFET